MTRGLTQMDARRTGAAEPLSHTSPASDEF